jgi:hypothetical protein
VPAPRPCDAAGTWPCAAPAAVSACQAAGVSEYAPSALIDEDFAELMRWLPRVLPVPGDVP